MEMVGCTMDGNLERDELLLARRERIIREYGTRRLYGHNCLNIQKDRDAFLNATTVDVASVPLPYSPAPISSRPRLPSALEARNYDTFEDLSR